VGFDDEITAIVAAARRGPLEPEELVQQRTSFALGNGNIDQDSFSRATVTVVVQPERAKNTHISSELPPSDSTRNAAEALLRQYDLVVAIVGRHVEASSARFTLTPDLILDLHGALIYPGDPKSGYRSSEVRIATNDFKPLKASEISRAVDQLCAYVNQHWSDQDAVELAAYALWRLNWIHPFQDGNGRTARALSYIVLSIRLGTLLPGSPTIPEQILQHRGDYYDALSEADKHYEEHGTVDVGSLKRLLRAMLLRQLGAVPALSSEDLTAISDAIERRVRPDHNDLVSKVFGEGVIEDRLWSLGEYLVLQVGPREAIAQAEAMRTASKVPFPRLLGINGERNGLFISASKRGLILRDRVLDASNGYALALEHNAAVTIERPHVRWHGTADSAAGWELKGALYVARFARELTLARAPETFDLLLARHIATLRK
jgi:hypothetical protein